MIISCPFIGHMRGLKWDGRSEICSAEERGEKGSKRRMVLPYVKGILETIEKEL